MRGIGRNTCETFFLFEPSEGWKISRYLRLPSPAVFQVDGQCGTAVTTDSSVAQPLEISGLSSALGTSYFSLDEASEKLGADLVSIFGETAAQPLVTTDPSDPERT